jgi:DNA-binding CsgD family transcriptional regulator
VHEQDPLTKSCASGPTPPDPVVDLIGALASTDVDGGRAPQALLEAAEKLADCASWAWNLETDQVVWSENMFRILGVDPAAVTPSLSGIIAGMHPDDRGVMERALASARKGNPPTELSYRIVTPAGTVRFLHAAVAESFGPERAPVIVGSLRDLTTTRLAEREIAAHVAVTASLSRWEDFEHDAEHLIAELGTAMGFSLGVMWLPDAGVLTPRATWFPPDSQANAQEVGPRRLSPGEGLAGLAWKLKEPVTVSSAPIEASEWFRSAAPRHRLQGAVAIPLIGSGDVLAVICLAGPEGLELTERLRATLTGIGQEIGAFLDRRLGELSEAVLSSRELEILRMAAAGLSGPDIATRLGVSPATVKTHFENIYGKYRVPDRVSAVAKAMRAGLIR